MAIEIDYFAWEKWSRSRHLDDFIHIPNEKFILWGGGVSPYIKNEVLVASIYYITDSLPARYMFFAETEDGPITKLLRYSWQWGKPEEGAFPYFDEVDIDEATAQAFHQDFSTLPVPIPAVVEYFPTLLAAFDDYKIDLASRYGDKSYDWGSTDANFLFEDRATYTIFYAIVQKIMNRCKLLNSHRYPKTQDIQEALKAYEKAFQSKAKYMKHRGRWSKPNASEYLGRGHERFWWEKQVLESFETKNMQELGNLIDFKHYLSSFLKFMALELKPIFSRQFSSTHETILFTKLKEADFATWDTDEQETITAYFLAFFQSSLSHYPAIYMSTTRLMLWFMKLEFDLAPYLLYWESCFIYPDALRHLGAFLKAIIEEKLESSLPPTLSSWFAQDNLEKALEDAVLAYENKRPYAHEFAEALEILQLIRDEAR